MRLDSIQSDILRFIIENDYQPGDPLPTIQAISQQLDVSVAKVRESLEIARMLGIVEVKPGRGTRVTPFRFSQVVNISALYAIAHGEANFIQLRAMRKALEIQFWDEAVACLRPEDLTHLRKLVDIAFEHLKDEPIVVPAMEHRDFHLTIFARLDNPFVFGALEAFWDAYEAFGLNLYRELSYHRLVWQYHARIVEALEMHNTDLSRQLLIEHMNLIETRPASEQGPSQKPTQFE